jgi:hypothetical protein
MFVNFLFAFSLLLPYKTRMHGLSLVEHESPLSWNLTLTSGKKKQFVEAQLQITTQSRMSQLTNVSEHNP